MPTSDGPYDPDKVMLLPLPILLYSVFSESLAHRLQRTIPVRAG